MSKSQAIFPAANAIESYRNSGYRHTGSAVAELIDNSFDANAKNVWIIAREGIRKNSKSDTRCIESLFVVDDGDGMDVVTMVLALQFGGGTQQERKNLGRFGMGLPNASVSQCQTVRIYSAEKDNKYYSTYLDVEEIKKGKMDEVPKPVSVDVKQIEKEIDNILPVPKRGTVVSWTNIDRFDIYKTNTLFKHLSKELGRSYRYFLDKQKHPGVTNKKLSIKLISLDDQTNNQEVLPIDPLFLMSPSQAPLIDGKEVLFKPQGGDVHKKIPFPEKKPIGYIYFKFSKAPKKVRHEGGSSQFGNFAGKQMGISILRNWREIDFDDFNIYILEPRDRFWGAEINFDTSLDEYMGVNYLKQGVRFEATDVSDDIFDENTTKQLWATITKELQDQISPLRSEIKSEAKTRESETKDGKATKIATKVILEGTKNPLTKLESDKDKKNPEQVVKQVAKDLGEDEKDPEVLTRIRDMIEKGFNFHLKLDNWEGPVFLSVKREGSQCIVKLNQNHRFFTDIYDPAWNSADQKTIDALDLLFLSFVGAQESDHLKREYYDHVREKWGEKLRDFLKELDASKK